MAVMSAFRREVLRTVRRRSHSTTGRNANPSASPSELYFLIASDERYSAPVMKIAERRAALGKGAVYLYYFRWETPLDGGKYKAPHTIEIPFAFHNLSASPWTAA